MLIFESFRPVHLIQSCLLVFGLWLIIDKYGMEVVAKSTGGLGLLVMVAVGISYLTNVLEKRKWIDGGAGSARGGPIPAPNDKKSIIRTCDSRVLTPGGIEEAERSNFRTLGGDEKGYRYGDRESTRACERGFVDFKRDKVGKRVGSRSEFSDESTSLSGFFSSGKSRERTDPICSRTKCEPTVTRVEDKHTSKFKGSMPKPKGDGFDSTSSSESISERSAKRKPKRSNESSKAKRDKLATIISETPRLSDFDIPRSRTTTATAPTTSTLPAAENARSATVDNEEPLMAERVPELSRTETRPEFTPDHAIGRQGTVQKKNGPRHMVEAFRTVC